MGSLAARPVGSIDLALAHARHLLGVEPGLAARQAREILAAAPGHPQALLILARAEAGCGRPGAAIGMLRGLVSRGGADAQAWRLLAELLRASGDFTGADAAHLAAVGASVTDAGLIGAALALRDGRLHDAQTRLRTRLKTAPTDVAAIRMLAEVAARVGRLTDAVNLLERAVELCPSFEEVRYSLALLLQRQDRPEAALGHVETLLAGAPADPGYRLLHAATLVRFGEQAQAAALYERLVEDCPDLHVAWLGLGHVCKALGRPERSVFAYRRVIRRVPGNGEAWWSLANLKTFAFTAADVAAMRGVLGGARLDDDDRLQLHFALGKALEDIGESDEEAFAHYASGNAIRRAQLHYDRRETTRRCAKMASVCDARLLARRDGCTDGDPIFIVGMPRSGSTLVEQILASHPLVEGTSELPDVMSIAARLDGRGGERGQYPGLLRTLDAEELRALGADYLARTRRQRKTGRPRFVDKMPNNWLHAGLIMLMLPNARIVDVRRHPLACCFANFKQHFARGQAFTYDLEDFGAYYRDYAELMAHFGRVAPSRIHRIDYEALVGDLEGEVGRVLDFCGLPFDEACLRYFETERAVRTASAEQVRQPIYRSGLEHWRRFERWLEPARVALEVAGAREALPV